MSQKHSGNGAQGPPAGKEAVLKGLKKLQGPLRSRRLQLALLPRFQTLCVLAPKAGLRESLGHRPRTLTEWGTSAESTIQTDRINATSEGSDEFLGRCPRLLISARLWRQTPNSVWGRRRLSRNAAPGGRGRAFQL